MRTCTGALTCAACRVDRNPAANATSAAIAIVMFRRRIAYLRLQISRRQFGINGQIGE